MPGWGTATVTSERRQTVKESAQYLREVRPIDPTEVATFVEGGAHPGTVRADLRALAPSLGLIERADGTFVPAGEGPIDPTFEGVDALPTDLVRTIEDIFVDKLGIGWPDGETGKDLRDTVDRLKSDYVSGEQITYDESTAVAYAYYHLPTHYASTAYVLHELGRDGFLDHHLRVLDVGAGVGAAARALSDYLPENTLLEYDAIEPSAAAEILETILGTTGRNVHTTIQRTTAEDATVSDGYDLVLFSSVLSELDNPEATVRRYLDALTEDGTLVLVSTGDRVTSTTLRAVERSLVDDAGLASVYAPTVRLWPDNHPTDRGWSWTREPDIETPAFQTTLAAGETAYINTSVRYSYALLRPDGKRRVAHILDRSDWAPMAESESNVTERLDMAGAKLSPDLGSANPLFKISDGSEGVDHYAVLVHESELTRPLRTAPYGAVLGIENGLLLWNDDEEGYNLVVDDEAVVEYLS